MSNKQTIAVLFGGQSGEHEVSLVSAHAVMNALDTTKYDLLPIGIRKDGSWLLGAEALAALVAAADPTRLPTGAEWTIHDRQCIMQRMEQRDQESDDAHPSLLRWHPDDLFRRFGVDIVFPVLHGPMGEDGTVQGMLELAGVPYVGCGVAASAVGLDKALMKAAFAAADLPQLPWTLVSMQAWERDAEALSAQLEERFHYPVFVKPANMGSSVGISKADNRATLEAALHTAAHYDRRIVVEQGIAAREIEVSILGNDDPQASIPGEIVPSDEWYTYEAKYLSGDSSLLIPAPIDEELARRVQELARQAFAAVDGSGLARVDFLLDKEDGSLWLNEINTMPGFTPVSMYAKMWAASGIPYSRVVNRLIELASERHLARSKR